MKSALITAAVLFVSSFQSPANDLSPAVDPGKPLFSVFAVKPSDPAHPDLPKVSFNPKRPLLTILTVRDLRLARDGKGVLLGLNARDTRAFAAITRKYAGSILILRAGDDQIVETTHITAPNVDGVIGFKHPQEAAFAEYLRHRFRLAEFKSAK